MKAKMGFLLALIGMLFGVQVWADAGRSQSVDYQTDYYMIVQSKDGGVDLYSEPDKESTKLNEELIPNGTALHITGEQTTEDGKVWGYTQYHGMNGYVLSDDLKPAAKSEAVQSEYNLYGGEETDYDIEVNAKDGSVSLYQGPGVKYGEEKKAGEIENGQKLHISAEVDAGADGRWGKTEANGYEGWVNLDEALSGEELVDVITDTPKVEAKDTSKAAAAPKVTKEPEVTATPEATKAPKATEAVTATPEAAEPTEEPTATPEATPAQEPTKEPTATPEETATPEPTEASEETATPEPTEASEETITQEPAEAAEQEESAEKEESSWASNPVLWILIIAVLIGLGVIAYLLKKKKEDGTSK